MIALIALALAQRPDEGGMNAFDPSDVLATYDGPEGVVRVTYSVSGPNATLLDDADLDGIPDFPELVAADAEAVLQMYADLGFRPPLSEADLGEGDLGGSPAFDFYLVDFGGTADGQFETDKCQGQVCGGFMVMENDFAGYGYPSLEAGIRTLTSHELFHAVQAAYRSGQESWIAEGTATWGEHQYDPDNTDFFQLCDALLQDPGRSINEPPAGPAPAFAYGTALFWDFLVERYGTQAMVDLQEAEDSTDGLDAVDLALEKLGTDWLTEWPIFVNWNLGTGSNRGTLASYPFADHLVTVSTVSSGKTLEDSNRFYPLSASYYTLKHPGGELYFATPDDPTGLQFWLFPIGDNGVEEPVQFWTPTTAGTVDLGDQPAGDYKFLGTQPQRADQSVKIQFCLGDEAAIADCLPADTGDTGAIDSGTPKTGHSSKEKPGGCGCDSSPTLGSSAWMLVGLLAWIRREKIQSPG